MNSNKLYVEVMTPAFSLLVSFPLLYLVHYFPRTKILFNLHLDLFSFTAANLVRCFRSRLHPTPKARTKLKLLIYLYTDIYLHLSGEGFIKEKGLNILTFQINAFHNTQEIP